MQLLDRYLNAVKPMLPKAQAVANGADAVLVKRRTFIRPRRQIVIALFIALHRTTFDEIDAFIEHAGVADHVDVAAHRVRQP